MGMKQDPNTGVCNVEPTDRPLDPNNPGRNIDNFRSPEIIEVVEDDSGSLTVILVVFICLLVPLVATLGFVVYLFRKNKTMSVSIAMGRRRSSVYLKESY